MYIIFYFSVLSLGILSNFKHAVYLWRFSYFVLGLLLVSISGFRYKVGTDYDNYIRLFDTLSQGGSSAAEASMSILVAVVDYFGLDYQLIFFIYSAITIWGYLTFIRRYSSNPGVSAVLFFFLGIYFFASMNLIRQFASVAIFLLAIDCVIKEKFLKYFLIVCMASLIHYSAILMLPVYFFLNKRIGFTFVGVALVVVYLSTSIIAYLAGMTKYGVYLTRAFEHSASVYLSLMYCLVATFIGMVRPIFNVVKSNERTFNVLMSMNYMSLLMVSASLISALPEIIFLRINYFFSASLLVLLPSFVGSVKNKYIQYLFFILLILLSSLYFFYSTYINGEHHNIYPYRTVLFI